jgi:hypothetical protein
MRFNEFTQQLSEDFDTTKRQRLDDLISQYRDATDPIGYDDDALDPDEVIAQIRQEFGDKIANDLEQGPSSHFPRDNHRHGYDPLSHASSPRVTKSGKMHSQDVKMMKNKVSDRLGRHTEPVLPEGQLDEIFNPSSSLAAFLRGVASVAGDLMPAALAGAGTFVASSALIGPVAGALAGSTAGNAVFTAMQNQQNKVPGMIQQIIEKYFGSEAEQVEFSVLHAKSAFLGQTEFRWRGKQWPVTLQKNDAEAIIEKNDKYWLDQEKAKQSQVADNSRLPEASRNYDDNRTGFAKPKRNDDEHHDLDVPRPLIYGLKINGKIWKKDGNTVTFFTKERALAARNAILAKRPDVEITLVQRPKD